MTDDPPNDPPAPPARPSSLLAEKAVRYLADRSGPVDSRELTRELLATRTGTEAAATCLLTSAFGEDPRLVYRDGGWERRSPSSRTRPDPTPAVDPDRVLTLLIQEPAGTGKRQRLRQILMVRMKEDHVANACGGDLVEGNEGDHLRRSILDTLDDAVMVTYGPPAAIRQLEDWLKAPVGAVISLRTLAMERRKVRASDDLEALAAKLDLSWRETGDPLDRTEVLDQALARLRRPGESLQDLQEATSPGRYAPNWAKFGFDREFLRSIPAGPGIYRFFDRQGNLLYIGKSRNLNRRVRSYLGHGAARSARVRKILQDLHQIQVEPSGSDLEAVLLEAARIRSESPARNRQRVIHARSEFSRRLDSILILEPAAPPSVLRVYLVRSGRLLRKVPIGPRGGGLLQVERILNDHFFLAPFGPTEVPGPDVEVEVVVRWLARNREKVVVFDPTDFPSARDVTDRLRWYLRNGSPFDADGAPIFTR